MPSWLIEAWRETLKQAPAVAVFSLVFIAGFYFQTRYLGEKMDSLAGSVTRAFDEQRAVMREAVSVIAQNSEVVRNNTSAIAESAAARRELAASMDRIKDFMVLMGHARFNTPDKEPG